MRAGVALLLSFLLIAPTGVAAGQAPGPLATTLDDHIGLTRDGIEQANETYGPREEFRLARAELGRAGLSLVNNATILAEDGLIKATGALETGKARAEAQGSTDTSQQLVEAAEAKIGQADDILRQVRSDLSSMEQIGLDGGLAVAHTLVRVMDMRHQYQIAIRSWEQGDHGEQVVRSVMTGASGALRMAHVAQDTLANVAEARQETSATSVLDARSLEAIADDRAAWADGQASPLVQRSYDRFKTIHSNGEHLLALAAYTVLFQDLAFNGLQTEHRRDNSATDPFQIASALFEETADPVDAWVEELGIPGDLPTGAIASGRLTLTLTENITGDDRANSGAYAASLVHLGAEHVGILQQAYGGPEHEPGTELATPGQTEATSEAGGDGPPIWLVAGLGAVILLAVVRFWRNQT